MIVFALRCRPRNALGILTEFGEMQRGRTRHGQGGTASYGRLNSQKVWDLYVACRAIPIAPASGGACASSTAGAGGRRTEDNAIAAAKTPNYTRMLTDCPHALLATSGRAVGLPAGQMGNSEVGHMNIGAGRVVAQDLPRIDVAIEDGSLAHASRAARSDRQGARQQEARCMSWACCRPAACTAIRITSPRWCACCREAKLAGLRACLSRRPRHAAQERARFLKTFEEFHRRARRRAHRHRVAAATTRWTATSAGTACSKAYDAMVDADGHDVRRCRNRRSRNPTRTASPTNSSCPAVIGDYAGMSDGDGCCSRISAPTARAKSRWRLLDKGFDGFERAACRALLRRRRHDGIFRRAEQADGRAVSGRECHRYARRDRFAARA